MTDFLVQVQLQVWQQQGDRLIIFMGMNEHVLWGPLACCLLSKGLVEATHQNWGEAEPHTFIGGVGPINRVWHTPDLEVAAVLQLSFHKGLGDRRTVLVDVTMHSAIGKHEFKVVYPHARRRISTNTKVRSRYISHLEGQMATHRMTERLATCEHSIAGFSTSDADKKTMQTMDTKMEEMQRGSKHQCRQIFSTAMPFSEPVRINHLCCREHQ